MSRNRLLYIILAALVLALPLAPAAMAEEMAGPPYAPGANIQQPIQAVDVASGEKVDMLAGLTRPTIITFMQTACVSCMRELKAAQEWLNENPGKASLYIVSVDMVPDKERFDKYSQTNGLRGKWFSDPEFTIPPMFNMSYTPGLVVIGPDRVLRHIKSGFNTGQVPQFKKELANAIM